MWDVEEGILFDSGNCVIMKNYVLFFPLVPFICSERTPVMTRPDNESDIDSELR